MWFCSGLQWRISGQSTSHCADWGRMPSSPSHLSQSSSMFTARPSLLMTAAISLVSHRWAFKDYNSDLESSQRFMTKWWWHNAACSWYDFFKCVFGFQCNNKTESIHFICSLVAPITVEYGYERIQSFIYKKIKKIGLLKKWMSAMTFEFFFLSFFHCLALHSLRF